MSRKEELFANNAKETVDLQDWEKIQPSDTDAKAEYLPPSNDETATVITDEPKVCAPTVTVPNDEPLPTLATDEQRTEIKRLLSIKHLNPQTIDLLNGKIENPDYSKENADKMLIYLNQQADKPVINTEPIEVETVDLHAEPMTNQSNQLQRHTPTTVSIYENKDQFQHILNVAESFAKSDIIPKDFRGKPANVVIALDFAQRLNVSPMAVMQNMYIIPQSGRPSFMTPFVISVLNAYGKFTPLQYIVTGEGDDRGCIAWAIHKESNIRLESIRVTMKMAREEKWGAKWNTELRELMFRYRSATYFARLHAPEIMNGIITNDEIEDIEYTEIKTSPSTLPIDKL